MLTELYDFEDETMFHCSEHGEYTEYELDYVGISYGCPQCYLEELEDERMESEGC